MTKKEKPGLEDLLEDKAFIEAVKQNDKGALIKWEKELLAGNIDAEVLRQAKTLVEVLYDTAPQDEQVERSVQQLWERVNNSVNRRRPRRWIKWTAAAAAVILLAFVALQQIIDRGKQDDMHHAKELLLGTTRPSTRRSY